MYICVYVYAYYNKIFPFFYCYQLPRSHVMQTNGDLVLKYIATLASENSKLCPMMFWKIAVSQPDLISH